MKGLLAQKIGMTRIIDPETGKVIPVTLLKAEGSDVLQIKTLETDGYEAVVLGSFSRKNFGKNPNKKYKFVKELELESGELKKGDVLGVESLVGLDEVKITGLESLVGLDEVKITGFSKGRGFSGVIKRHNFARGRETHGSHHHREPGSSGMCAKPGRILKGKKMPGHYGDVQKTSTAKLVEVDVENKLLAIKGAVPGAKKSYVIVRGK